MVVAFMVKALPIWACGVVVAFPILLEKAAHEQKIIIELNGIGISMATHTKKGRHLCIIRIIHA